MPATDSGWPTSRRTARSGRFGCTSDAPPSSSLHSVTTTCKASSAAPGWGAPCWRPVTSIAASSSVDKLWRTPRRGSAVPMWPPSRIARFLPPFTSSVVRPSSPSTCLSRLVPTAGSPRSSRTVRQKRSFASSRRPARALRRTERTAEAVEERTPIRDVPPRHRWHESSRDERTHGHQQVRIGPRRSLGRGGGRRQPDQDLARSARVEARCRSRLPLRRGRHVRSAYVHAPRPVDRRHAWRFCSAPDLAEKALARAAGRMSMVALDGREFLTWEELEEYEIEDEENAYTPNYISDPERRPAGLTRRTDPHTGGCLVRTTPLGQSSPPTPATPGRSGSS